MIDRRPSISDANAAFWDELCGTTSALSLGVTDDSAESLALFDDWYFRFYPYLERYIPFTRVDGKEVLEVGLGYGSVAQRLAEHGARYRGLDIADGPVGIVNHRLRLHGLNGEARKGDVLACPFADERFDLVIAIGCFHHTGDMGRAIDETWRVLRPGGEATVMVYNSYSYRRWVRWPSDTWRYRHWDRRGGEGRPPIATANQRRAYDPNSDGQAPPETAFASIRHLARLCARFSRFEARTENAGGDRVTGKMPRSLLLSTLGRVAGLDIYCRLVK